MEDSYTLNIGRIAFQGETVFGKVVTNSRDYPGLAPMFFAHKNKENQAPLYEVMIYDPTEANSIQSFMRNAL